MPIVIFQNNVELANLLRKANGPATLESTVMLVNNKKSRETKIPFEDVFMSSVFITKREYVYLGIKYEDAVNRQREREDKSTDFVAGGLPWGEWWPESRVIIEHKDNLYMRYYVGMSANYKYSDKVHHFEDGTFLTEEETDSLYKEFMPPKKEAGYYQGLNKGIEPRCVKFEGIFRIRHNKTLLVRDGWQSGPEKRFGKTLEEWHDERESAE